MKISRARLKEIVKEVMVEETEYQQFFQNALDKAGKSIPDMGEEEKKAFFDKIDAAWNGKGEKNESVKEAMQSGSWVGFTKTPKGKKYHATFSSGKQAEQWATKNNGGAMPKSEWDSKEAKYAVESKKKNW